MQKYAILKSASDDSVARIILHAHEFGVHIFFSKTKEDKGAFADQWRQNLDEAEIFCEKQYGITKNMWRPVSGPFPGCQCAWIRPVRVVGYAEWVPFDPDEHRLV